MPALRGFQSRCLSWLLHFKRQGELNAPQRQEKWLRNVWSVCCQLGCCLLRSPVSRLLPRLDRDVSFSARKNPQLHACVGGAALELALGVGWEATEATKVSLGPGFSPSLVQMHIPASLWVSPSFLSPVPLIPTINMNLTCFLFYARPLGRSEDTWE